MAIDNLTNKPHKHIYDAAGNQLCCTAQEAKIYADASAIDGSDETCCTSSDRKHSIHASTTKSNQHHGHAHEHNHDHLQSNANRDGYFRLFIPALISFILLLLALVMDHLIKPLFFTSYIRLIWYLLAYIPVGWPVIRDMWAAIRKREYFSEFTLMVIATLGALAIGEYPEAVAVMLFYTIGEIFQTLAVQKARANVRKLLDQRPDQVTILENNLPKVQTAKEILPGAIIQLKPGEKLALDGILINDVAYFNTAALTGESVPDTKIKGDNVLAGMVNLQHVATVHVTTPYDESKLSKMLDTVQHAQAQKAPTELFIRKFAKVYTPIVVISALLLVVIPYFLFKSGFQGIQPYELHTWLYRALIFLVISCPCALVISIPLGYFGGIGAASRNGILVKGSNFLDVLAKVNQVVLDKTGTMTEGLFKVNKVYMLDGNEESYILPLINTLESKSSHPVATAIHDYVGKVDHNIQFQEVLEHPGLGLAGVQAGNELLVGNFRLLDKKGISYDLPDADMNNTVIAIAYKGDYIGYLVISDQIRSTAKEAVAKLQKMKIEVTLLSGDRTNVVKSVADQLNIKNAFGDLLPLEKVEKIKLLKSSGATIAFVGDGVNDAPAVALSDVGIAMGGLGSDATIETADVVIQDDNPAKIPIAINIAKKTRLLVIQNITLAFIIKGIVLILGASGHANMWEAVFADVGVALVAILNAVRIQKLQF